MERCKAYLRWWRVLSVGRHGRGRGTRKGMSPPSSVVLSAREAGRRRSGLLLLLVKVHGLVPSSERYSA
jgi:hypothetical protein